MPQNNDPLGILGDNATQQVNDPLGILSSTPPEKKNLIGTPSQNGSQGLQGTPPLPSSKPTRATPLEGLGGVPEGGDKRNDGTYKGRGYFGPLQLPNGQGVATEYSVGVEIDGNETEIPMLTPNLTDEEVKQVLLAASNNKVPSDAIIRKAYDHATKRISKGLSPFADQGKEKTQSETWASNIVDQSLNPPRDERVRILDGQQMERYKIKQMFSDRSFVDAYVQGNHQLQIQDDPELEAYIKRQITSRKTNDTWDSFMSSMNEVGKMGVGSRLFVDDLLEEITNVPNLIGVISAGLRPNQQDKVRAYKEAIAPERRQSMESALDRFIEGSEKAQEARFQVEGDFINLVHDGNIKEAVNMALNTTVESSIPSLLIGLGAAATGGGVGMAAMAKGGLLVTPLFIGGEYAEQLKSDDEAIKQLSTVNKFLRPTLRGGAEMAGEVVSTAIWGGSLKVATASLKSLVGKAAIEVGTDAAEEIAKQGGKELAKELFKSIAIDPVGEGVSELMTYSAQEITDQLMGVSNKSMKEVVREGANSFALGWASGGIMTAPSTGLKSIQLSVKGVKASKKFFDQSVRFDPASVEEMNKSVDEMRATDQEKEVLKEEIAAREKAVGAVPENRVSDTETVDLVQEKQKLQEEAKNLDDAFKAPVLARIAEIDSEIGKRLQEKQPILEKREAEGTSPEVLGEIPSFVQSAVIRVETDKPTSVSQIEKASEWLYAEYKKVRDMKGNPSSPISQKQVDTLLENLSADIEILETAKSKIEEAAIEGDKGSLTKFTTPTDKLYGQITENGETRDLTKEEYLALEKEEGIFDVESESKPVAEKTQTAPPKEETAPVVSESTPVEETVAEPIQAHTDKKGREIVVRSESSTSKQGTKTTKYTSYRIEEGKEKQLSRSGAKTTVGELRSKIEEGSIDALEGLDDSVEVTVLEERSNDKANSATVKIDGVGEIEIITNGPLINKKQSESRTAQPFLSTLGGTPVKDLSEDVAEGVFQTEVDGVDVLMSEPDANTVKLESIRTPKAQQRQGKAKAVLAKITAKADELGKAIVLDVIPEGESTTEAGLRKLYEEAGFVADGKTSMRREPVKEESKIEEAPIVVSEDKVTQEEDYRGAHTAPRKEGLNTLDDPTDMFGDDIYSPQAARYFGHGDKVMDEASARKIQSFKGKPDAEVTIYRAVPKGVKDINAGDWVTINKKYAQEHGESHIDGEFDIIEKKVKANELTTDANSIHEWGYSPEETPQAEAAEEVDEDILSLEDLRSAMSKVVSKEFTESPEGQARKLARTLTNMGKRGRKTALGVQIQADLQKLAKDNGFKVVIGKTGAVTVTNKDGKEIKKQKSASSKEEKAEKKTERKEVKEARSAALMMNPISIEHWVAQRIASGTRFKKSELLGIAGENADIPAWMWAEKGLSLEGEEFIQKLKDDGLTGTFDELTAQQDAITEIAKYAHSNGKQAAIDYAESIYKENQKVDEGPYAGYTEEDYLEIEANRQRTNLAMNPDLAIEIMSLEFMPEDVAQHVLDNMKSQEEYESSTQYLSDIQKQIKGYEDKQKGKRKDATGKKADGDTSEAAKIAKRLRDKKIGGVSFVDPLFGAIGISKSLYDGALELAARQVEKGTKLGTAIANAIKYIDERMSGKKWDKGLFGRHLNDQFKMTVAGKEVEVKRDLSEETLEVVNGWYSPLEKSIKDTKADSLTAKEWLDKVRSKEGEDFWTGLRGMLEAKNPKDRVSKRELLAYLKDNRVDVVEVVKEEETANKAFEGWSDEELADHIIDEMGADPDDVSRMSRFHMESWAEENADYDYEGLAIGTTKFSRYQLEGEKENYKEVIVILPRTGSMAKVGDYKVPQAHQYGQDLPDNRRLVHLRMNTRKDSDGNKVLFLEEVQSDWGQKGKREGFVTPEDTAQVEAFERDRKEWNRLGDEISEEASRLKEDERHQKALKERVSYGIYTWSGVKEFGENSVVYTKSEGVPRSKSELIEKSDLPDGFKRASAKIEEGKKVLTSLKEKRKAIEAKYGKSYDGYGETSLNMPESYKKVATIPSAPFVTDTNSWVKLAVKVALKEAVAQGVDKIAWTTGEQQNDRYDLQKQVDYIDVFTNDDGTYHVIAVKGNNTISEEKSLRENQLEGLLGKDLTNKIVEDTKKHTHKEGEENLVKTYRGNDLSVGGKGMKGFYGSPKENSKGILGSVVESITGQEPKTVDLGGVNKKDAVLIKNTEDIKTYSKKGYNFMANKEKISKQAAYEAIEKGDVVSAVYLGESSQPSIEITPELKSAVEKGQPLFGSNLGLEKARQDLKDAWKAFKDEGKNLGFADTPENKGKRLADLEIAVQKALIAFARKYVASVADKAKLKVEDIFREFVNNGVDMTRRIAEDILDVVVPPIERVNVKNDIKEYTSSEDRKATDKQFNDAHEEAFDYAKDELSGIMNDLVPEDKKGLFQKERRTVAETLARGKALVESKAIDPWSFMQSILKTPRPLSADETAAMIYYKASLDARVESITDQINKAREEGDIEGVSIKELALTETEAYLEDYYKFQEASGYEQGLSLRMRQLLITKEYELANQIRKYKKETGRKFVPAEILAKFKVYDEAIRELNKRIVDFEKRSEQEGQSLEILSEPKSNEPRTKSDAAKQFAKKIRDKKFIRTAKQLSSLQSDPAGLFKFAWDGSLEIIATTIEQGGAVADAVDKAIAYLKKSEWYKNLSEKGKNEFDSIAKKSLSEEAMEYMNVSAPTMEDGLLIIPDSYVRSLITQGFDTIDTATAEAQRFLSENLGMDVTERQVRDAITNYGKQSKLSKDEVSQKLREMRRVGKLVSAIEDLKRKERPLRSGMERDAVTQKEREMRKEINALLKDIPQTSEETDAAWKSALDSVKQRLRNRIEDLNTQISEGKKTPKKKSIELDAEAKYLKEESTRLSDILRSIEGKPEMTFEQRVNITEQAIERSIQEYERRIKEKDFEPLTKTPVSTPEIENLRAQREVLRKQYTEAYEESPQKQTAMDSAAMKRLQKQIDVLTEKIHGRIAIESKKESNTEYSAHVKAMQARVNSLRETLKETDQYKKAAEKKSLENAKKAMSRSIQEYERRIKEKDFAVRKSKQVALDAEAKTLKAEQQKWKNKFDTEREKYKLDERNAFNKMKDMLVDVTGAFKSLGASLDFSSVLRQGGMLSARHPKMAVSSGKEMIKQTFSEAAFEKWMDELIVSDIYNTAKQSGLYIAAPNAKLLAKEESFVSNIAEKIPIYGKLVRSSNRAYSSYLNAIRVAVFSDFHDQIQKSGLTEEDAKAALKDMAVFINNATGRGSIGDYEPNSPEMNLLFFSPRYVLSRANIVMNTATGYATYHPKVRKEALLTVAAYVSAVTTLILLSVAGGAEAEDDPRSSDFGKIKIGNLRLDPLAGLSQMVTFFSRILTGQTKSISSGEVSDLSGGGRFGRNRLDVIGSFIRSKMSPVPSALVDFADSEVGKTKKWGIPGMEFENRVYFKNIVGEEQTLPERAYSMITPIYTHDIMKIYEDEGLALTAAAVGSDIIGIGSQYHSKKEMKAKVGKSETSIKESRKEKAATVQEIKDSEVERLKTELKGDYVNPSNISKMNVVDTRDKLSGTMKKDDVPSKKELRMELAERHNAKVFSEKEPDLARIFVTDDGKGNSFGDDYLIMASQYKDGFLKNNDPLKIKEGDEKKIMDAMKYLGIVERRKHIQKVNKEFKNIPTSEEK